MKLRVGQKATMKVDYRGFETGTLVEFVKMSPNYSMPVYVFKADGKEKVMLEEEFDVIDNKWGK